MKSASKTTELFCVPMFSVGHRTNEVCHLNFPPLNPSRLPHLQPPFAQLPRLLATAPSAGHVSNADPGHLTSGKLVLVTGQVEVSYVMGDPHSWLVYKRKSHLNG